MIYDVVGGDVDVYQTDALNYITELNYTSDS